MMRATVGWITFTALVHCAHGQFIVTALTGLSGDNAALNNVGQVIAGRQLWDNGVVATLPGLGSTTIATDINDRGQIVGRSADPGHTMHAVLWENGTLKTLAPLVTGAESYATAINEHGQIVGYANSAGKSTVATHATYWDSATAKPADLGALPGQQTSYAFALNNHQTIAGVSRPADGSAFDVRTFLYNGGVKTPFGPVTDGQASVEDINDAGTVVGGSRFGGNSEAYRFRAGSFESLGTLGGTFSTATAINEYDEIVGRSTDASGRLVPFLYRSGTMVNLAELLNPQLTNGRSLQAAWDINDRGDIVLSDSSGAFYLAKASTPHPVPPVPTTVPEPRTFTVLGAACLAGAAWFRARVRRQAAN